MYEPSFAQIRESTAGGPRRDSWLSTAGGPRRSSWFSTGGGPRRGSWFSTNKSQTSRRSIGSVIDAGILEYDESDVDDESLSDLDDFLMTGTHAEHDPRHHQFISHSAYFKGTVVVVILLNTIVIGLEATYMEYQFVLFDQLEMLFTLFYVVEIGWRIWERGIISFLSTDDWWWSWFDLLITSVSLADICIDAQNGKTAGASVGRLFRICRILRMFRAMKFLNEVDFVLAHAAQATMKLALVVALVLFVAAIFATNMLWDCPDPIVAGMFGDLGASLWSLFKLMTLDDWVPVCERVLKVRPGMIFFFVVFIFTTSVALVSLIPAMFIEVSLTSRENKKLLNREREQRQHRHNKKRLLHTLFKLTDRNENGKVSVEEIKAVLKNDSYLRHLRDAGLTEIGDLRDVRLGLFEIFEEALEESASTDHEITEESFTNDLLRMREDVSPLALWRSTTATRLMLRDLSSYVRKEMEEMRNCTRHLENEMKQIFVSARAEIMNLKESVEFPEAPSDIPNVIASSPSSTPELSPSKFQSPETLQSAMRKSPKKHSIWGGAASTEIFGRIRSEPLSRNMTKEFTFIDTPFVGGGDPPPQGILGEQPAAGNVQERTATPQGVSPTSILGEESAKVRFGRTREEQMAQDLNNTPFVGGGDGSPPGRFGERPAAGKVKEETPTPTGSLDGQGSRNDRVLDSLGLSPRQPPTRGTEGIGQVLMRRLTKDWGRLASLS